MNAESSPTHASTTNSKRHRLLQPIGLPMAFTINDFCALHRIGRTLLYQAWREGWGPEYFLAGKRRRIPYEVAHAWRGREVA